MSADLCFARLTGTILRVGLFGWVSSLSVSLAAQAPAPTFPMTLQQAVQQAVANYPAVQASAARVAAQEATRLHANSRLRAYHDCAASGSGAARKPPARSASSMLSVRKLARSNSTRMTCPARFAETATTPSIARIVSSMRRPASSPATAWSGQTRCPYRSRTLAPATFASCSTLSSVRTFGS